MASVQQEAMCGLNDELLLPTISNRDSTSFKHIFQAVHLSFHDAPYAQPSLQNPHPDSARGWWVVLGDLGAAVGTTATAAPRFWWSRPTVALSDGEPPGIPVPALMRAIRSSRSIRKPDRFHDA
jgi:hypothetical protein